MGEICAVASSMSGVIEKTGVRGSDPRAHLCVEAQCNALSGALDQVLGYYLSLGPQDQCDNLPVVLVGQQVGLEELPETCRRFWADK